jgi:peptidoglycan hydrolase-like protein with peptidoglycan-binding domain
MLPVRNTESRHARSDGTVAAGSTARSDVARPGIDPASTPSAGGFVPSSDTLRFLQATAGNGAVGGLLGVPHVSPAGAVIALQRQPPLGEAPAAHRTLRRGSTGLDVTEVQGKLNRVDPVPEPLVLDGIFGRLTKAAVIRFQESTGLDPDGVVGPLTHAALDAAAAAAPPLRPTLVLGDQGPDVGIAQQKLNSSGAAIPRLPIEAVFDAATMAAVMNFQVTHMGVFPTGVIDRLTWAALEAAAPGGGVVDESGTPVEQHVDTSGGSSTGVPNPGTSLHRIVGPGGVTNGPAVEELQQKLNIVRRAAGVTPLLVESAVFSAADATALRSYQASKSLAQTGVGDIPTWNAIDVDAPAATVGAVSRAWKEEVGGNPRIGMTSDYSWRLGAGELHVTAKVNFTGNPPAPAWFQFVRDKWNRFKAWNIGTDEFLDINFEMVQGTGPDAATVAVVAPPTTGRANAGRWFLSDTAAANTIPHEYGHLVGLRDEYQQHPADYVTVTGHEPPVGETAAPAGVTAAQVAQDEQNAMAARNSAAANTASVGRGMKQGAFAQQVVSAYTGLPAVNISAVAGPPAQTAMTTTGNLVRDLETALPPDPAGGPINKYNTIEVFTYTSGSLMGDPGRVTDPHDHGVQPRHVQEFIDVIARVKGGAWVAIER